MATTTPQAGLELPAALAIPASILSNGIVAQSDCDLLNLTNEILLCVLKTPNLDAFDKACLALTCKRFGNLVYGFGADLKLFAQLKSGDEEMLLDLHDDAAQDEDGWEEERLDLQERFDSRADPRKFAGFLRRLDEGWVRTEAQLRHCYSCGVFRTTTRAYWQLKTHKYKYKSLSVVANKWRRMEDCYCGCKPDQLVEDWLRYGDRSEDAMEEAAIKVVGPSTCDPTGFWYIPCPDCVLSMSCRHDDCGCCGCGGGCHCGGCC